MEYITIGNKNGNVKIKKTAALAPMASVADRAYRTVMKAFGASYVVGEMTSSKGLSYSDRKSAELLTVTEAERPMAVQLFGCEPEFAAKAVETAESYAPDIIDINSGCPVPKVAGNGSGCALMKDPAVFGAFVSAVINAAHVPVTVKIRKGWDAKHVNAVEIARLAESLGAAAITVHGRTRAEMYGGTADISIIKAVKDAVGIPVIGSGDVTSVASCVRMYEETGCDLVMIGRGSYGNPWLFRDIDNYFSGRPQEPPPELDEKMAVMRRHIELLVADKGELTGMKEARMQAGHYIKGIPNAARYRNLCGSMTHFDDLEDLIKTILDEHNKTTGGTL